MISPMEAQGESLRNSSVTAPRTRARVVDGIFFPHEGDSVNEGGGSRRGSPDDARRRTPKSDLGSLFQHEFTPIGLHPTKSASKGAVKTQRCGVEQFGIWTPFTNFAAFSQDTEALQSTRDELDQTKKALQKSLEDQSTYVSALAELRSELAQHVDQACEAADAANKLAVSLERKRCETQELKDEMEWLKKENRQLLEENTQLKELASQLKDLANESHEGHNVTPDRCSVESESVSHLVYIQEIDHLRNEVNRLRQELAQSAQVQNGGNVSQGSPVRTSIFKPRIAVYDIMDSKRAVRRIVRIEAPGRHLDADDSTTVSGSVRSLDNGISITLSKAPDIPHSAMFCDPYAVDDFVGSWDWDYHPRDGVWQLEKSWGYAHGIFAVALKSVASTKRNASPTPKLLKPARSVTPLRRKRSSATAAAAVLPVDVGKSSVAVVAPPSSQNGLLLYFREDTVFVGADGTHVDANEIQDGTQLLGPEGAVEVVDVIKDANKYREMVSIWMEHEVLTIVLGSKVASVALTRDRAATVDWDYNDIRGLQAGSHELGIRAPSGAETTAPIHSIGVQTQQAPVFAMQLDSPRGRTAVYVVTQRHQKSYLCRPKQGRGSSPKPAKSSYTPKGPFASAQQTATLKEQRRTKQLR